MISAKTYFTLLLLGGCYLLYAQAVAHLEQEQYMLLRQQSQLEQAKNEAQERQACLQQQLDQQDDPAWIEWNLIRSLGLVPEGYTKVFFFSPSGS